MGFPLPLPVFCRGFGKRKWEASVMHWHGRVSAVGISATALVCCWAGLPGGELGSANGEAVTVGGFDDDAIGGHCGEALVECGCADAA